MAISSICYSFNSDTLSREPQKERFAVADVMDAYSMASDQLCGSMLFKSCAAVFFAQRICAMPKFLAVLRVPARILGNALFSNGF